MSLFVFMSNEMRLDAIVRLVDIDVIVGNDCLSFLYHNCFICFLFLFFICLHLIYDCISLWAYSRQNIDCSHIYPIQPKFRIVRLLHLTWRHICFDFSSGIPCILCFSVMYPFILCCITYKVQMYIHFTFIFILRVYLKQ